jgi:hypothetical protein
MKKKVWRPEFLSITHLRGRLGKASELTRKGFRTDPGSIFSLGEIRELALQLQSVGADVEGAPVVGSPPSMQAGRVAHSLTTSPLLF